MSRLFATGGVVWFLVVFAAVDRMTALADDGTAAPAGGEAGWEQVIDQALEKNVSLQVVDTPLKDVAVMLAKTAGVPNLLLDDRALGDIAIGPDTPVTIELKDVPLRTAFRLILRELGLTYVLREGALVITTPEEAERELVFEIFDVVDLVRLHDEESPAEYNYDPLLDVVPRVIAPPSWQTVGGPGSIATFHGTLVVSQTRETLAKIRQLFEGLRQARDVVQEHGEMAPPITSILVGGPQTQAVDRALDQKSDFQFKTTPLSDVVARLGASHKIDVRIDEMGLGEMGVRSDAPITFTASDMTLRHALHHMLQPLNLTHSCPGDSLTITSPDKAESSLQTRIYPVADLWTFAPPLEDDIRSDDFSPFRVGWCGSVLGRPIGPRDSLIELITTTVAPESWDDAGGPGIAEEIDAMDLFVVSQTPQVHEQIETLLKRLREKIASQPRVAAPSEEKPTDRLRLVVYVVQPPTVVKKNEDGENETTNNTNLPPLEAAEALEVVQELVEPDSWTRDGVYARTVGGRLIIRQTEAVHREIREILNRLGVFFYNPLSLPGRSGGRTERRGMGGTGGDGGSSF